MKLRAFVGRHRLPVMIIGGAVVICVGAITSFLLLSQPGETAPPAPVAPAVVKKPPVVYYSPLNGVKVADQAATTKPVTAIMIENGPNARPQSGIKQAEVVYEAIAEAGITRFLALYQQNKPALIGPVRSLRMYYIDWLAPYQPSVAHVGGSLAAVNEIRNGNYRDIDQFFNSASYWRATDRRAPHNVYTNFEKLDALNASKQYTSSTFTSFTRADGATSNPPTARVISLNFSNAALYNTRYEYDTNSNTYKRFVGGQPSTDREQGQVTPSVVVALSMETAIVKEDGLRLAMTTIGSGKATIFQNGTVIEGTWRKSSRAASLELLDASGKPIALARGQTWIAAIPTKGGAISWQQ